MAASRNSPATELPERVAAYLAASLPPGQPICVALSGGCDSVVLLHLLARLCRSEILSALHVHHGLSSHADDWAEFCQDYADGLGVPCRVVRVSVPQGTGEGIEAAARRVRYAALAEAGVPHVCLGHHATDQAETVLFNLCRGGGIVGLAGMPAQRSLSNVTLHRPLLSVTRSDIEAYAHAQGLNWVTDESNADLRFSRNFLRHRVLTVTKSHFPAVEQAIASAAAHCVEANELLDELALLDWTQRAEDGSLPMRGLRELSLARLKNLLRFRLRQLGWQVPVANRLNEFARQLLSAGPDRHPCLDLPAGKMHVEQGRLCWRAGK